MRILVVIVFSLLFSCDNQSLPKQKGYFAPEFSYPKYGNQSICNFEFIRNLETSIIKVDECNLEIDYKKLDAKIYFNKINLKNNFGELSSKFEERIFNNSEYADQILTSEYSNIDRDIYSKIYFFVGDTPSNIQFYITDSLSNYISASLYFNSKPNYDSLLPYIHYIRSDIKKIIESFVWIN
mgnify:FL=1